jgi:hypothetical protein
MRHESGDGCAIYNPGYQVYRWPDDYSIDVEDLIPGDYYRDPAFEREGQWLDVVETGWAEDDVHIGSEGPHTTTEELERDS